MFEELQFFYENYQKKNILIIDEKEKIIFKDFFLFAIFKYINQKKSLINTPIIIKKTPKPKIKFTDIFEFFV